MKEVYKKRKKKKNVRMPIYFVTVNMRLAGGKNDTRNGNLIKWLALFGVSRPIFTA